MVTCSVSPELGCLGTQEFCSLLFAILRSVWASKKSLNIVANGGKSRNGAAKTNEFPIEKRWFWMISLFSLVLHFHVPLNGIETVQVLHGTKRWMVALQCIKLGWYATALRWDAAQESRKGQVHLWFPGISILTQTQLLRLHNLEKFTPNSPFTRNNLSWEWHHQSAAK